MYGTRSVFGSALGWALSLLLMTALSGCQSAKEQAKAIKKCSGSSRCRKPNVCLRRDRAGDGVCVYPCRTDDQCPRSFRCSGSYTRYGKPGLYCRKPSLGAGDDCSRVQPGCKKGLRCFKFRNGQARCIRSCLSDAACPTRDLRCLKIVGGDTPDSGPPTLFKGCIKADRTQGQACGAAGPFCARDHVCRTSLCVKQCVTDKQCSKSQICDGTIFRGPDARQRAALGGKPDLHYCRRAGERNAVCSLRKDVSCRRGLFCLDARCREIHRARLGQPCRELRGLFCAKGAVCYDGLCRKDCAADGKCPGARPRQRRSPKATTCQPQTVHGQKVKICL